MCLCDVCLNPLQGTSLILRAAQAGLTAALGVRVGCSMKMSHPKVQLTLSYRFDNIQRFKIIKYLFLSYSIEEYLYVAEAPGQQLTEAQTRTPLLGPSGPACTLSFEYALTGTLDRIGNEINSFFF